jgi:hypothetical protein
LILSLAGYRGIQLLRRHVGEETEFITSMTFDWLESVREFAGKDYGKAVGLANGRVLLSHYDEPSVHYEIKAFIKADH